MDLCVAYDDVPSHVSWASVCLHSFVRSSHKAEASEAPIGTRGRMEKIMPASPCHPVCLCLQGDVELYIASARLGISFIIRCASNALCLVLIPCNTFNSFPHRTTMDCFLRNGLTLRFV